MTLDVEIETLIKILALRNSIEHEGKAHAEAVVSKVVASRPDLRNQIRNLLTDIRAIVQRINSLTIPEQKLLLEELAPNELDRKPAAGVPENLESHLPPLKGAEHGMVITRFPPEPNGYPHIGHAKAAIIDEEYARMYGGKLILRFDDTNPLKEKTEYYDAIRDGLEWLGVKPDLVKNTSDDIELLHEYGSKLVELGGAYVCTCSQEKIRDLRSKGVSCECRKVDGASMHERAEKFFDGSYRQNEAVVRFRGNMDDQNTAMRDPTLFRIIEANHPRLGDKIRVWPTYDFAAPIEDSVDGVTHAMRTKEYELRNELYFAILERLGLRKPSMIEFSRLEFEGIPVSKRKLRPLIEDGTIKSWNDPRLPTLAAFRRRGFSPVAIRKFVISLGLTLAETKPPFEALEAFNRKLIDPISPRLFYVKDPVEIHIDGGPENEVVLKNHPTDVTLGTRSVKVQDSFFIAANDAAALEIGNEIRLIELYNVKVTAIEKSNDRVQSIAAVAAGNEIRQSMPKIQWVAKNDAMAYNVIIAKALYTGDQYNPQSLEVCRGYVESFVSTLRPGAIIQFVRFGFCRIDDSHTAIMTHR